ncbi:hypothetical protein AV274_6604 [Blastocystis sp. ATCC 50177/Nand II]|uniref:MARVEL domain-containing protein n=1 Tax=Blastocystis sp. subtype 1 (strain ATCC 50177 / NandII) TaxID=478820 RepID=A0A196S711_BLAHN|nr:hypothetical protein AV274_6604 [Blastocystis sp. ATCC 50177/Nand II]
MARARRSNSNGLVWTVEQIVSAVYIVVAILAMIGTSTASTFGVAIFFLMLWNVIILIGLFVWYFLNTSYFKDSDLFHGMYCGVTLIEGLNILVEAVLLIAESSAISGIQGTSFTKAMYILLAIVSVFVSVMQFVYVKTAFYSKRK